MKTTPNPVFAVAHAASDPAAQTLPIWRASFRMAPVAAAGLLAAGLMATGMSDSEEVAGKGYRASLPWGLEVLAVSMRVCGG